MPFEENDAVTVSLVAAPPHRPPAVVLEAAGWEDFKLLTTFTFQDKDGVATVTRPSDEDHTTDLASVPKLFWGLLAPYGHQLRAALLHDQLCMEARAKPDGEKVRYRREADDLFREALNDSDVSILRRNTFWAGVTFGRFLAFQKRWASLIVVAALVSTLAFWISVVRLFRVGFLDGELSGLQKPLTTFVIVLLASALLLWKDRRFALTALLISPLVMPVGLLTLATQIVLYLLDWILTLLLARKTKKLVPPVIGPTLDWQLARK